MQQGTHPLGRSTDRSAPSSGEGGGLAGPGSALPPNGGSQGPQQGHGRALGGGGGRLTPRRTSFRHAAINRRAGVGYGRPQALTRKPVALPLQQRLGHENQCSTPPSPAAGAAGPLPSPWGVPRGRGYSSAAVPCAPCMTCMLGSVCVTQGLGSAVPRLPHVLTPARSTRLCGREEGNTPPPDDLCTLPLGGGGLGPPVQRKLLPLPLPRCPLGFAGSQGVPVGEPPSTALSTLQQCLDNPHCAAFPPFQHDNTATYKTCISGAPCSLCVRAPIANQFSPAGVLCLLCVCVRALCY